MLRKAALIAASSATSVAPALAIPPPDMLAAAPAATAALKEQAAPKVLYTPPSVKGQSSPDQIALAEHLKAKGAKFYGAYWCKFCDRQRQMFGAGASRVIPYVECAADGYQSSSGKCLELRAEVTGYPTWYIDGKYYGGMRTLQDLQALSGFDPSVKFPEYVPPPPPPRPAPPPGGFRSPPVETTSNAEQLALAKHLTAKGATFYGAYWCGYCNRQRQLFGASAAAALPYVECAADGYQSGSAKCRAQAEVTGYPTWEINGQFYGGYKSLEELARLSGFEYAKVTVASTGGAGTVRGDGCTLSDGAENCDK